MKIIEKYKQLDKQLAEKMDLTKIVPQYFEKTIFWCFMMLIVAVAMTDLYFNDFQFKTLDYECYNYGGFCPNPFYNNTELPSWVCEKVDCNAPFLEGGYRVGRNDYLSKNRTEIMWLIIIMAFIVNHLVYMLKFKTITYKGKEWHEKRIKEQTNWEMK